MCRMRPTAALPVHAPQLQVPEPAAGSEGVRGLAGGSEPGTEVRAAVPPALLLLRGLCTNDRCADYEP